MLRSATLALLLLVAAPGVAQTRLSPDEYEALAVGRTLHYTHRGQPFGAEQYFSGGRTLWRFATGQCSAGKWYADGANVCFDYEGNPRTLCWAFQRSGNRVRAHLLPDAEVREPGFALDLSHIDDKPLACPGPDVGM